MTQISAAMEALRTSREALPENERVERWEVESSTHTSHPSQWVKAGGMSVADCGYDGRPSAAFIALVDPHVVQALEELLPSIEAALVWIEATPGRSGVASILAQRTNALCRAITRETP